MRVLFVTHYTALLGANRSMLQLMKELRDKGVEVAALIPNYDSDKGLRMELERASIPYYVSKYKVTKGVRGYKNFFRYVLNIFGIIYTLWMLRGLKFDIIHTNSSVVSIGKWIALLKRSKHVWHFREFGDLDYGLSHPLGSGWQRVMYAGADAYIAISSSIATHFAPYVHKERMHIIYNGVLQGQAEDSTHTNVKTQFVMVGVLSRTKNQLLALKAASALIKNGTSNFHITIVGRDDDSYSQSLHRYVEENDLNGVVTFTGFCTEVPSLLSKMDVGLMLSSHEAFGRTTVEYMLQNLAVIATPGGANREIITNGVDGLILKNAVADELADSMLELIKNKDYLLRLAAAGKQTASSRFVSTNNSKQIYELYNTLLS